MLEARLQTIQKKRSTNIILIASTAATKSTKRKRVPNPAVDIVTTAKEIVKTTHEKKTKITTEKKTKITTERKKQTNNENS